MIKWKLARNKCLEKIRQLIFKASTKSLMKISQTKQIIKRIEYIAVYNKLMKIKKNKMALKTVRITTR